MSSAQRLVLLKQDFQNFCGAQVSDSICAARRHPSAADKCVGNAAGRDRAGVEIHVLS